MVIYMIYKIKNFVILLILITTVGCVNRNIELKSFDATRVSENDKIVVGIVNVRYDLVDITDKCRVVFSRGNVKQGFYHFFRLRKLGYLATSLPAGRSVVDKLECIISGEKEIHFSNFAFEIDNTKYFHSLGEITIDLGGKKDHSFKIDFSKLSFNNKEGFKEFIKDRKVENNAVNFSDIKFLNKNNIKAKFYRKVLRMY